VKSSPFILLFSLFSGSFAYATGPYIEAGTSLGRMSGAGKYFQDSNADSTGSGFLGSFSLYFPVTSDRNFFHFDLGVQTRLATNSTTSGESLAMASINIAARLEISRFFVGGGYAPLDFVSKSGGGLTSLHSYASTHSYFLEGGVIWRVIPELQIAAAYGLEFGLPSGGRSPSPASEYGLRFRFPLSPKEGGGKRGVDFDGFRYPFGVMK
jgi:hypothetical protein